MKSILKPAYILKNSDLLAILKEHLSSEFDTSRMSVRFTGTNVCIANITPKPEQSALIPPSQTPPGFTVLTTRSFSAEIDEDEDDGEWEGYDEDEDDDSVAEEDQVQMVRNMITVEPRTVSQIVQITGLPEYQVRNVLSDTDEFATVAPAREGGKTVSMYMRKGTHYFDGFKASESKRIADQVVKFKQRILAAAPGPNEDRMERPAIVDRVCMSIQNDHYLPLSTKELCEEIRRDARAVFYAMAECDMLYHSGHGWQRHKLAAV